MPRPETRSPRVAELFSLAGRGAIVTGAAGILGRGFCAALARQGARVALLDVADAPLKAAEDDLLAQVPGADVVRIVCDVSRNDSVENAVAAAHARFGSIDVLVNNAATKGKNERAFFTSLEAYPLEVWREVMAVNLDGMFLMAQAVGRRMLEQGRGGSIVQTASIYGVVAADPRIYEGSFYLGGPINTPAVYSASKAGILGLTRHLAACWGPQRIRVNALSPGGVQSGQNTTFSERYSQRVPLGRMAAPRDMEGALLFLASDASSYVTGQNIVVDGGLSSW